MMIPFHPTRRHERIALALASTTSAVAVIGAVLLLFDGASEVPSGSRPESLAAADRRDMAVCGAESPRHGDDACPAAAASDGAP